jgi:RHS repeat-associated protein
MGLPSKWSQYLFGILMFLLPVMFFMPAFARMLRGYTTKRDGIRLSLFHRCLSVLLAYLMLLTPCGIQQLAEGSILYSQLDTRHWSQGNRTIHYQYDDNGSMTKKITALTGEADPENNYIEKATYDYNLQNRLERVTVDDGDNVDEITEYTYNDDGIRVKSYYYQLVDGTTKQNEDTKIFLIDPYNHTGYAQVLEQWVAGGTTPDTTYTIGDDVITEKPGSGPYRKHLLYDGHGSTRQVMYHSGSIADTYSYDGYGVMLGGNPTGIPSIGTNLLYAGEYFDTNLQHYNLRARWYDPLNGRFNQLDPYAGNNEDPQSLHKYLYCHANPVNRIDPLGTFSMAGTLTVISTIMSVMSKVMTGLTVAVYGYRSGGVIYKLTSGEQQLVDEAFLEAEDLVKDIAIDVVVIVATFGVAKLLQKAASWIRGAKRLAAVTRFNRNIECGAKAESYILGSTGGKKAFTTSLGTVVPDRVTLNTIDEVKNVGYLSNSPQMKKMVQLAKGGDNAYGEPVRKLILHVREDTVISGPLMDSLNELVPRGLFELARDIPPDLAP